LGLLEALSPVLAAALSASGFAAGLLAGLYAGAKLSVRDAAMLGTLDRRVATALQKSADAMARADALEAGWQEALEAIDTKRRRASTERQRADEALAKAAEVTQPSAPQSGLPPAAIPEELQGAERRRAISRRLRSA
jgi:uncharacterized protein (DUF1501 family)